jgi:transposase-like protein
MTMKYSYEFKENIVKKALSGRNVKDIAVETGVTAWSIYQWIKQLNNGSLKSGGYSPRGLSLHKKQQLLLEAQSITEENQGEWLRKNGVHTDHLNKWQEEIFDAMDKNNKDKIENRKLKEENKLLQKELNKKDKALAEVTALLALKKKLSYLWEDEEK